QLSPEQADYHALLGWAGFVADGGGQRGTPTHVREEAGRAARDHLKRALELDPDSLDAHDHAGRIAAALGDDEQAIAHLELAPDDPRPREALARLHAENPGDWRQAAQALRETVPLQPAEGEAGPQLFHLHLGAERWDAALAVAGVLACRGIAEPTAAQFLGR